MNSNVYIDPSYTPFLGNALFNARDAVLNRDDQLMPFIRMKQQLEEAGVKVATADFLAESPPARPEGQINKYYSLGIESRFEEIFSRDMAELEAFVIMEPPIVASHLYEMLPRLTQLFNRVYLHNTVGDGYSLEGVDVRALRKFHWPLPYDGVVEKHWQKTGRLERAVVINGNHKAWGKPNELYSERIRAMVELSKTDCVDLYGMGWDKWWDRRSLWPVYFLNLRTLMRIYKGPCGSKYEVLENYEFCLCIENMQMQGYMTEKVFDCLYAGCIPLYCGAPDIADYLPKECYLDRRDFASWTDMWAYSRSLNVAQRQAMRDAGRDFLKSAASRPFLHSIERIVTEER